MAEDQQNKEVPQPSSDQRIQALEQQNAMILDILNKMSQAPPQQPAQQKMDPAALAQILPLLGGLGGGSSESTMDGFFNELGKRAFYNVFDKTMPSRKEIRSSLK